MTLLTCPHCGANWDDDANDCPSCGKSQLPLPTRSELALEPIRKYIQTLREVLLTPTAFFQTLPMSGGLSGPLAFALITHWIASAIQAIWLWALGGAMGDTFTRLWLQFAGNPGDIDHPGREALLNSMQDRFLHWVLGAGSVIADPFLTLASVLFTGFFIFIGARILVAPGKDHHPKEITFESSVRIVCYGMSPAIVAVVPLVGQIASHVWIVLVTIIGAREVYKISTGRAVVVALFPKLLLLGIFLVGMLIIFFALIQFLAATLG